jgi:tetratricopeptide (TPR) repeat protein
MGSKAKKSGSRAKQGIQHLWPFALIVFGVALVVRVIYLLDFSASPIANYFILDPRFYHEAAINIVNGTLSIHEATYKAPLYPYFLAAIYGVAGPSAFAARLVQVLLGSFSCVMIFFLAGRFYARGVALTAGLIAALYGPLVLFDSELLIPTLIIFLNLASFLLLFKYEDSGSRWLLFASGLLLGLSALARPNILIILPGVVIWLWRYIHLRRRRNQFRQAAFYVGGVVVMLLILLARNYSVTGEANLFGNYGGYNFLIGNNRLADGRTAVLAGTSPEFEQGYVDAVAIANTIARRNLDDQELNWFWLKLGMDYIATNPLQWLGLEAKKFAFLTAGFEIPNNRHVYFFAQRSAILRPLLWDKFVSFPFGILLPLALVAVFARQVRRNQYLLTFFLTSYSISILLFFVNGRYRLPIIPILIIWAAAGAWQMVSLWRAGEFQRFYRLLAVFLVALLLCNALTYLPGLQVRPETEYESHLYLGSAYFQEGQYEKARRELLTAAKLYPKSPRVYNALGNTFYALGNDSLAGVYYRLGVEADPDYEIVVKNLVNHYKRNRKLMEFNDLLLERIDHDPNAAWARKEYAWLHTQIDAKDEAIDLYQIAWETDTTDFECLFHRAQLLLELDMRADAEREYNELLERFPNSVEAHANLGQVYARQGRLDEALLEFEWVREREPGFPGSYFNLATVHLQRGELNMAEENLREIERLSPNFPSLVPLRKMIEQAKDSVLSQTNN